MELAQAEADERSAVPPLTSSSELQVDLVEGTRGSPAAPDLQVEVVQASS